MKTFQATSLVDSKCLLGEGPVWYEERFWWVDIQGKVLLRWKPGDNDYKRFSFHELIGFAVPNTGKTWSVGLQSGIHEWNPESGALKRQYQPEKELPDNRFNDGKADPQGRLWAGTMSTTGEKSVGSLYRCTSGYEGKQMVDKVTISNGLAWDMDRCTMYYIDTPTRMISAFDFEPDSGKISNRRDVIAIPAEAGHPDGMTIDEEGKLWVALWNGFGVCRVDPQEKAVVAKINVPAPNVTSCTFGGTQLETLYITTARAGISEDVLAEYPDAGNVFSADVGARGLPVDQFLS